MSPAEQQYAERLITRIVELERLNAALVKELKLANREEQIILQLKTSYREAQNIIRQYKQKYEGAEPDPIIFGRLKSQLGHKQLALAIFGDQCFYCDIPLNKKTLTFDHIVPVFLGGRDKNNLVPSCYPCNLLKAATPPPDDLVHYVSQAYQLNALPPGTKPTFKLP